MKTKTIKVYEFEELKPKIQEKVLNKFRNDNEYIFLYDYLKDFLKDRLKEKKIKEVGTTTLYYSLSYSQGDGCCFIGMFEYKNYIINIKHNYRYYHSKSVDIEIFNQKQEEANEKIYKEFKELYEDICYEVEKTGYNYMEMEDSEENIKENIKANEYTFRENGEIEII